MARWLPLLRCAADIVSPGEFKISLALHVELCDSGFAVVGYRIYAAEMHMNQTHH
jgi:hypothetical protein